MWFFSFASGSPGSGQTDFGVSGHISRVFPSASPTLSQPESTGSPLLWQNLPPKGEHLLDKLSQVLTEGFAAGPLALSVAVERVGAGGLFVGRAAEEEKGPSDGTAVMLWHSHVQGQPSGTHGRPHSNGPRPPWAHGHSKTATGLIYVVGRNPPTLPTLLPALRVTDPGPFHLSGGKNTKCQSPTRLYLSLLGVCMVLCPLGRG